MVGLVEMMLRYLFEALALWFCSGSGVAGCMTTISFDELALELLVPEVRSWMRYMHYFWTDGYGAGNWVWRLSLEFMTGMSHEL